MVASLAVRAEVINPGNASRAITGADDAGRGDRLSSAAMPLVFGLMYTLARLKSKFTIRTALSLIVFPVSLYLTASRGISVVVVGITLAFIVLCNVTNISIMTLFALPGQVPFSLYLIIYPELNPFYLATDTSGLIRILSVNVVADLFHDYWVFGTGIAFGIEGYYPITGVLYFVPGDIGYIGMLFCYGIFGFLIYLILVFLACTTHNRVVDRGYSQVLADSLVLTSCIFALYGLQPPQFDSGSSASLLAMACLALALDKRQNQRGQVGAYPGRR